MTSLSGAGVLSFDHFTLGLSKRVTFVVGPNGAGKSNTARLLTICQPALDLADGAADGMTGSLRCSWVLAISVRSPRASKSGYPSS